MCWQGGPHAYPAEGVEPPDPQGHCWSGLDLLPVLKEGLLVHHTVDAVEGVHLHVGTHEDQGQGREVVDLHKSSLQVLGEDSLHTEAGLQPEVYNQDVDIPRMHHNLEEVLAEDQTQVLHHILLQDSRDGPVIMN